LLARDQIKCRRERVVKSSDHEGALRGSKRPASSTVATDQYKCDDIGDTETYELVLLHLGATVAFAKGLVMPLL
jgi:hypothetical protein